MKISKLIKLLEKAKKEHGDIQVIMDISDTDTTKQWSAEDPCYIGIRREFGKETIEDMDQDGIPNGRRHEYVTILPDFIN